METNAKIIKEVKRVFGLQRDLEKVIKIRRDGLNGQDCLSKRKCWDVTVNNDWKPKEKQRMCQPFLLTLKSHHLFYLKKSSISHFFFRVLCFWCCIQKIPPLLPDLNLLSFSYVCIWKFYSFALYLGLWSIFS